MAGRGARAAVFLDRDGVLTEPVWNPATSEYESAHHVEDVRFCPDILPALRSLQASGYDLFIVSNQPSYAKGKASLDELQAIARTVEARLSDAGVALRDAYYCFHHPDGIVPEYSGTCACRKPAPYFLRRAAERYDIDLSRSWMVGDRDTDVECGQRAGCRTVLVDHPHAQQASRSCPPDHIATNLREAATLIVREVSGAACVPTRGGQTDDIAV
jgi:D-glycero-D-manno-heptose 1,7-bisphosphate phosphatase